MNNDNLPPDNFGNYTENNNSNNNSGNNSNNQNQGNNPEYDRNQNVENQNTRDQGNNSNQNNSNQDPQNNPNYNSGQNVNDPRSSSGQNYSNNGGDHQNKSNYGGPNDPNNSNFDNGNSNKNNNNRNIILAILGTLIFAGAIYFLFLKDKKEVEKIEMAKEDTIVRQPVLKADTIAKPTRDEDGEYYEDQDYVTESYVVANEAFLRSSPSASPNTMVNTMKFGDKVYLKNGENVNGYSTVYLSKPANEKSITEQPYYLLESTVVSQYEYKEFKEFFSLAPFSTLASKTKKLILDKNYDNGIDYKVTQNSDRAKNALSYGDFDRDGIMDVAIVLDNNEKQASRLLIICTNKATKDPYLAFAENYSDKVKINSFKKGSSIFMNTDEFMSSPNDGIIVKGEDVKIAMIYDNSLQKFKSYYQE